MKNKYKHKNFDEKLKFRHILINKYSLLRIYFFISNVHSKEQKHKKNFTIKI